MKKLILITSALLILLNPISTYAVVEEVNLSQSQPGGIRTGIPIGTLIASALQIIAIIAGLTVLIFIVWGAFDWITSGGDKEKVSNARKKITNALIGLALLALASFIVALFGDLVGINPFRMGNIPQLGQTQPNTPGTTP